MKSYGIFAQYYDSLTGNVAYDKRCDYLTEIIRQYRPDANLLLDLACGTGSLSFEFAQKGFDVIGVDASAEMLSVAMEKQAETGTNVLFLCQKMQDLDLFGTIDAAVCTLDSINHLLNASDVQQTFRKVSLFLEPGGVFVFDVNSEYKHAEVLGNETFVFDFDPVFCVWQNSYRAALRRTRIQLDFFERNGQLYRRSSESFEEQVYATEDLTKWLESAGMEVLGVYAEQTFEAPKSDTERLVFVTRKRPS